MSAPPRVSVTQIRETLEATGGNVQAAAARLGVARNNLYKRIINNGLSRELANVRQASKAGRAEAAPAPHPRSIRVSPALYSRLREAKFDLQAKLRQELDEADVLEAFVGEAFEEWLAEKLGR